MEFLCGAFCSTLHFLEATRRSCCIVLCTVKELHHVLSLGETFDFYSAQFYLLCLNLIQKYLCREQDDGKCLPWSSNAVSPISVLLMNSKTKQQADKSELLLDITAGTWNGFSQAY